MAMQAATLEILEKADLPPRQARAIAQAIELEVSAGHSALATRADFLALRQSMETQFVSQRQDLDTKVAGLRQQTVGLKHDLELKMSEHKSELVRWVFLCIL